LVGSSTRPAAGEATPELVIRAFRLSEFPASTVQNLAFSEAAPRGCCDFGESFADMCRAGSWSGIRTEKHGSEGKSRLPGWRHRSSERIYDRAHAQRGDVVDA
jgi:hypothetical protein